MRVSMGAALAAVLMTASALAASDQSGVLQYPASFFADSRPSTAYDMIARLPGFVFDDGQSARGFAGTAGNVLIDGQRPTAKTNDLQAILNRIPASDVDHVEVIRGGTQDIDMHGQAVVANIVRKKGASTQLVVDVSNDLWTDGHMNPAVSLQLTHRAGETTYELALETSNSYDDSVGHGFYNVTDVAHGIVQHFATRSKNLGLGWSTTGSVATPLWGGQFKANFTYQDSPDAGGTYYAMTGNDFSSLDHSGTKKGEIGLHWLGPVGKAELEMLVLQRLERDTDFQIQNAVGDVESFAQRNRSAESIARATLRYHAADDLTLEAGAEGAYNQLDGASTYIVNAVPVPLPSGDARVDEKRGEVFAQANWNFAPTWKLEVGSRFEYSVIAESGANAMSREFFYPKPRVLLAWTPVPETQLRLRLERVLGQLDFSNFIASSNLSAYGVNAGNPNLAPDRHWQFELAFEQHFGPRGAVSLSLLHEDIAGVLDYIPVTGSSGSFDAPGNIGGGHKNVIDLETTLPLDDIGLTNGLLKTTTVWRLTGVRDPATGQTRAISGVRPRNFRATLTQDIDSLKSTWSAFFFTGWHENYYRPSQLRQRGVIPLYVELEWDYKPTPQWLFSIAAKNVGRFGYDDINTAFDGLRGTGLVSEISEYKVKSQARLYVEVKRTF